MELQCLDDLPDPDIEIITDEADECGTPVVAFTNETFNTVNCRSTIVRTYTVTDDCGNTIELDHVITIEDTSAPVLLLTHIRSKQQLKITISLELGQPLMIVIIVWKSLK
jgi:hypothetical protein